MVVAIFAVFASKMRLHSKYTFAWIIYISINLFHDSHDFRDFMFYISSKFICGTSSSIYKGNSITCSYSACKAEQTTTINQLIVYWTEGAAEMNIIGFGRHFASNKLLNLIVNLFKKINLICECIINKNTFFKYFLVAFISLHQSHLEHQNSMHNNNWAN